VTSQNGFSGGVSFSCDNVPAKMSCSPSPGGAVLAAGGSSGVKVTVGGSPASGTYAVDAVVTSNDGAILRRVTLSVTVA
jgi:hypothetical protein